MASPDQQQRHMDPYLTPQGKMRGTWLESEHPADGSIIVYFNTYLMRTFSTRVIVRVPAENTCPLSVDLKIGSCFSHTDCWLEVQTAICREGLVGQDQLLADFDFDLHRGYWRTGKNA